MSLLLGNIEFLQWSPKLPTLLITLLIFRDIYVLGQKNNFVGKTIKIKNDNFYKSMNPKTLKKDFFPKLKILCYVNSILVAPNISCIPNHILIR